MEKREWSQIRGFVSRVTRVKWNTAGFAGARQNVENTLPGNTKKPGKRGIYDRKRNEIMDEELLEEVSGGKPDAPRGACPVWGKAWRNLH